VVAAELRRLSPEQIVVLGGESAVSQQVADEAAAAAGGSRGDPAAQPVTGVAHPIAFAYEPASGCQGPCEQETTIWTMRSDGGAAAPVTVSQDSFDRSPRWAPGGSQLAFARVSRASGAGDLYVLAVAGDGFAAPRRITDTADVHGGRGCYGRDMVPAWSPDSARIAFTCGDGDDGASAVLVAAADGSGQFSVPAEATDADAWPTWSPGSDRLAFARRDLSTRFGDPGRVAVWTAEMGASGAANPRPLVSGERAAGHPQWSPVGDQILFVELDELALRPTLKVVTVATGDSRVLYEPPRDRNVALYHASWSPGGSAVALPVGDGLNDSVVHVIAAATGRSVAVSPPDTVALAPGWSPDGSRVLFDAVTRDQAGVTVQQLVTVGVDGGSQALLGVPGGHAYDASWRPGS
ncbi:MAG: hypothetical protein M3N52_03250, partial [Actinomycetota bacterium]|nr:hypothetical protein [Actinomycetota bacterium]